jgi:uncharacterized damage-inducible protein DinB
MLRTALLLKDFVRETGATRKHFERIPEGQWEWRPHLKSFPVGQLAAHLVDCIRWVGPIFRADELYFDPRSYRPCRVSSLAELLAVYDAEVVQGKEALEQADDANADRLWRLIVDGRLMFEKPREAVFRDMTLSHLVHHRGQLSVYLRLLDVPVPSSYGPTADDRLA